MGPFETKAVTDLRANLKGRLIMPGDPGYDQARTVFIGGIDRRPGVIVRVADTTDVAHVVSFARESGLELAIRSGGHARRALAERDPTGVVAGWGLGVCHERARAHADGEIEPGGPAFERPSNLAGRKVPPARRTRAVRENSCNVRRTRGRASSQAYARLSRTLIRIALRAGRIEAKTEIIRMTTSQISTAGQAKR